MLSLDPRHTLLLRDAVLLTALLAVPMALYRAQVEPAVLRIPGIALYIPFMIVYIVLGSETENDLGRLRQRSGSISSCSALSSRQSRIWFGSGGHSPRANNAFRGVDSRRETTEKDC